MVMTWVSLALYCSITNVWFILIIIVLEVFEALGGLGSPGNGFVSLVVRRVGHFVRNRHIHTQLIRNKKCFNAFVIEYCPYRSGNQNCKDKSIYDLRLHLI